MNMKHYLCLWFSFLSEAEEEQEAEPEQEEEAEQVEEDAGGRVGKTPRMQSRCIGQLRRRGSLLVKIVEKEK